MGSFLRRPQQPLISISDFKIRKDKKDGNPPAALLILTACTVCTLNTLICLVCFSSLNSLTKDLDRRPIKKLFCQAPPRSSKEVKCLLISTLTASGLTSSISLRLVRSMRRPWSQHEAHINRTRETTDKGSPQRPDCGGIAARSVTEKRGRRDLRPRGFVMWPIRISQLNDKAMHCKVWAEVTTLKTN